MIPSNNMPFKIQVTQIKSRPPAYGPSEPLTQQTSHTRPTSATAPTSATNPSTATAPTSATYPTSETPPTPMTTSKYHNY